MRLAVVCLLLECVSGGKKREQHGADLASWVRDRTHHLNKTDETGDEVGRDKFAGVYECPDTGEAYSAAFLCREATFHGSIALLAGTRCHCCT